MTVLYVNKTLEVFYSLPKFCDERNRGDKGEKKKRGEKGSCLEKKNLCANNYLIPKVLIGWWSLPSQLLHYCFARKKNFFYNYLI